MVSPQFDQPGNNLQRCWLYSCCVGVRPIMLATRRISPRYAQRISWQSCLWIMSACRSLATYPHIQRCSELLIVILYLIHDKMPITYKPLADSDSAPYIPLANLVINLARLGIAEPLRYLSGRRWAVCNQPRADLVKHLEGARFAQLFQVRIEFVKHACTWF